MKLGVMVILNILSACIKAFTQSDIFSIVSSVGPSELPCPGRSIDKTLYPCEA